MKRYVLRIILLLLMPQIALSLEQDNSLMSSTAETTLEIPPSAVVPVGNQSLLLTVINTGNNIADHVHLILPESWDQVSQNSDDCITIPSNGGQCTIVLTSTKPYLAKLINISGDNITNRPKIAVAFSIHNYLVFQYNDATRIASVIYATDSAATTWSYKTWDRQYLVGATSHDDGASNTKILAKDYQNRYRSYFSDNTVGAAVHCTQITEDNGNWYLPAIDQLLKSMPLSTVDNIQIYSNNSVGDINRLFELGFGQLDGKYWSSTEYKGTPDTDFEPSAAGTLLHYILYKGHRYDHSGHLTPLPKDVKLKSRCVKDMPY